MQAEFFNVRSYLHRTEQEDREAMLNLCFWAGDAVPGLKWNYFSSRYHLLRWGKQQQSVVDFDGYRVGHLTAPIQEVRWCHLRARIYIESEILWDQVRHKIPLQAAFWGDLIKQNSRYKDGSQQVEIRVTDLVLYAEEVSVEQEFAAATHGVRRLAA